MIYCHPKELKIEVNRNCPLNCLHCSSNGMPYASEQLHPNRVYELIAEFAHMGGKEIAISGGEPLFYTDIKSVIKACNVCNLKTTLYTTGIAPTGSSPSPVSPHLLKVFSENNVRMIFSLHGAQEETHDLITQVKGSFLKTMTAMERALQFGIETEVHVVPTAVNFDELSAIANLLDTMRIRKMSWLRFVPQGRGLINRVLLELTQEQLTKLGELKTILQNAYPKLVIRTGAPFNILGLQRATPCKAAISEITIRPDGQIAPCDAFKRFDVEDEFSSIKYHSLREVWERSQLLNEVRRLHEIKPGSSCVSCPYYELCQSGCPAQKAIAAGMVVSGKDPNCLLTQMVSRHLEVEEATIC